MGQNGRHFAFHGRKGCNLEEKNAERKEKKKMEREIEKWMEGVHPILSDSWKEETLH